MSSSLILCNDNEPFLHQIVTCDKKWILYGSLVPGLRRSSKALAKAKLALKRVMITAWQSAASLIHYCFLNSSETVTCEKYAQQIDEMHQKLQCLQPALVTERAQLFSMTTQVHTANSRASEVEGIGLRSFASSAMVTWPLTNCYHFFKHLDNFLQGKCFHNQQQAENAFQEFTESWSTDFLHCRNKQMYVLVKMRWL